MRKPMAERMALPIAAIGGTTGTSPTPRVPNGCRRIRHLDQHRLDHRHVGGNGAAVVQEAWIIELALGVVDVLLAQRPADALRRAAMPVAKVTREPPVTWVKPIEAVLRPPSAPAPPGPPAPRRPSYR